MPWCTKIDKYEVTGWKHKHEGLKTCQLVGHEDLGTAPKHEGGRVPHGRDAGQEDTQEEEAAQHGEQLCAISC